MAQGCKRELGPLRRRGCGQGHPRKGSDDKCPILLKLLRKIPFVGDNVNLNAKVNGRSRGAKHFPHYDWDVRLVIRVFSTKAGQ